MTTRSSPPHWTWMSSGGASRVDGVAVGLAAAIGVVLAVALGVLYVFAPEQNGFYPRCWLYAWTGLQCPGCGGLRAMHHLLHGEFGIALRYNPLLFALAPLGVLELLARWRRRRYGRPERTLIERPGTLWTVTALAVLFMIVRNLPLPAIQNLLLR